MLAFVVIGRASHGEGSSPVAFLDTLWPFGVGMLVGWWVLTRRDLVSTKVQAGLVIGVYTAVVGLAVRGLVGQGIAGSFALVAVVVLSVFMTGWRTAWLLVGRARRARR